MTLIRFPIGDWSDDGHGKCDYFIIEANMPIQEVREIHFSVKEKLGFDVGDICNNYEESELSEDIFDKLVVAGFTIENSNRSEVVSYFYELDSKYMDTEGIVRLWIDILMFIEPKLSLELRTIEGEDINFYGFDKKQRHLKTPGYGCFIS